MSMDEPLQKVVAGSWDREAFATEYKKQQEIEMQMNQLMPWPSVVILQKLCNCSKRLRRKQLPIATPADANVSNSIADAVRTRKAMAEIDKMIAAAADAEPLQQFSMKMMKVQALMQIDDEPKLVAAFQDALTSVKEQPTIVLQCGLGWSKWQKLNRSRVPNVEHWSH